MRMMFFASRMAGTFILIALAILSVIMAIHVAQEGTGAMSTVIGPNWESTAGQALHFIGSVLGLV
jgi:hypothetical protein